jgi:GNAT superfamily N-acetyltransferase
VFKTSTWVVAREAQDVIGLAKSVKEPGRSELRNVESVWVAPSHRRRGVLSALLYALVEIHRPMGVTELLLWVLEDNHAAWSAYLALGFVPTGERQFLQAFGRFEQRLRLEIDAKIPPGPARREVRLSPVRAKLSASPGL